MDLQKLFNLFDLCEPVRIERNNASAIEYGELPNYEVGKNLYKVYHEGYVNILRKDFKESFPNLTVEDASIIYMYTAHGVHDAINNALRGDQKYMDKDVEYYGSLLTEVLSKVSPFSNATVYREITGVDDEKLISYYESNLGQVVNEPSFLSTYKTYDLDPLGNRELILVITTSSTSNGRDITDLSMTELEEEILFIRDTKFKVIKVDGSLNLVELVEVQV